MARKQGEVFPSDHRRWFRVTEDILDEPKLQDASPAVFRFYINLLAMLNRTKSRDGSIVLTKRALCVCAGREQHRHSLTTAREGAVIGLYRLSADGVTTSIMVHKWPEIQGFAPAEPRRDPDVTPTTTPTPKKKKREEEKGDNFALSTEPKPARAKRQKIPDPGIDPANPDDPLELTLAFVEWLAPRHPSGAREPDHLTAWWDATADRFREYATKGRGYARVGTAIKNWWGKATPEEIDRAVASQQAADRKERDARTAAFLEEDAKQIESRLAELDFDFEVNVIDRTAGGTTQ